MHEEISRAIEHATASSVAKFCGQIFKGDETSYMRRVCFASPTDLRVWKDPIRTLASDKNRRHMEAARGEMTTRSRDGDRRGKLASKSNPLVSYKTNRKENLIAAISISLQMKHILHQVVALRVQLLELTPRHMVGTPSGRELLKADQEGILLVIYTHIVNLIILFDSCSSSFPHRALLRTPFVFRWCCASPASTWTQGMQLSSGRKQV